MKDEKTIGKKVWLLIENHNGLQVAIDTGDWTIVAIKPYNEVKDYCNHLVVKNDKGVEQEVREYNAIFVPRPELQGDEQIGRFLEDNGCYNDGVFTNSEGITSVEISWGDWKHEHIWCDHLMRYLGYTTSCEEEVTEENGSDCYSAIHFYEKATLASLKK